MNLEVERPGAEPDRQDLLVGLESTGVPGQGMKVVPWRVNGSGSMRGSPTGGAPTSSSSGTWCACANGNSSSRVGRRPPDSSRDRVLIEDPCGLGQLGERDTGLATQGPESRSHGSQDGTHVLCHRHQFAVRQAELSRNLVVG
jgi:hypothetical protein